MNNIKPTLILTLITTLIAALLIVTSNFVKIDDSVLSSILKEKCVMLSGEGEYKIVADWLEAGYAVEKPKAVQKLILKDDGTVLLQVVADGYAKEGLNLLVLMNKDGSVENFLIAEMGETPGLGTKVNNPSYLENFMGKNSPVTIVKGAPKNDSEIAAITGATYSSKGVAKAINTAIEVYKEMGVK